MLQKIEGYLLIPHELLHVAAYRIIGKQYIYRFGDLSVRPLEERTVKERLFCLLFPLGVNLLGVLILLVAWFATFFEYGYQQTIWVYLETAPPWHHALHVGWISLLVYACTCALDVQIATRLLVQKLRQ